MKAEIIIETIRVRIEELESLMEHDKQSYTEYKNRRDELYRVLMQIGEE